MQGTRWALKQVWIEACLPVSGVCRAGEYTEYPAPMAVRQT